MRDSSDGAGLNGIAAALAQVRDELEKVREVPGELEAMREREENGKTVVRRLTVAVAAVAVAVAATVSGFAWWNLTQDEASIARSARLQHQNTLFRERVCADSRVWRVYLATAPAGGPEGRAAASRLITDWAVWCR